MKRIHEWIIVKEKRKGRKEALVWINKFVVSFWNGRHKLNGKKENFWFKYWKNLIVFESGYVAVHLIVNENGKKLFFSSDKI